MSRDDRPTTVSPGRASGASPRRGIVPLVIVALAGTLAVGGTFAYIVAQGGSVENSFAPGSVSCQVLENGENGFVDGVDTVKSHVKVENEGNVDAHVRAEIVVNWVNADGDVLGIAPVEGEGKDYHLVLGSGWAEFDGFYYYVAGDGKVAGQGVTSDLVESCTVTGKAPVDGYVLQVDVVASAVQADGTDSKGNRAVALAWGVDIAGGDVAAAIIED